MEGEQKNDMPVDVYKRPSNGVLRNGRSIWFSMVP